MNRSDRIMAFVLGGALFAGLFYFIYTAWKSAPAGAGAAATDMTAPEDFNMTDEATAPPEGTNAPAVSTTTAESPAAAPADR